VDGGEIIERGDHLVGDRGQQPRRLQAAGAVLQPLLGDHPAAEQRPLQDLDRPAPLQRLVADGVERGCRELGAQPHAVDDVFDAGRSQAGWHGQGLYSDPRPDCPATRENRQPSAPCPEIARE
jgi:hypothetical protein